MNIWIIRYFVNKKFHMFDMSSLGPLTRILEDGSTSSAPGVRLGEGIRLVWFGLVDQKLKLDNSHETNANNTID